MRSPPRNEADGGCIFPSIANMYRPAASFVDRRLCWRWNVWTNHIVYISYKGWPRYFWNDMWLADFFKGWQTNQTSGKSDFEFGCNVCLHLYLAVNDMSFNNWVGTFRCYKVRFAMFVCVTSRHVTFNVWCKSAIKFGQGQNCNFETVFSMV